MGRSWPETVQLYSPEEGDVTGLLQQTDRRIYNQEELFLLIAHSRSHKEEGAKGTSLVEQNCKWAAVRKEECFGTKEHTLLIRLYSFWLKFSFKLLKTCVRTDWSVTQKWGSTLT